MVVLLRGYREEAGEREARTDHLHGGWRGLQAFPGDHPDL